ncbi:putative E3 ubiquitin-protein ligase RHA2B [Hibiscus syriacus]|uniref:E3 ubiquitin-protein ligase RHA2B n=1 Tax=Hibiscus syriacus TaxID=106335 RepID=A0A6A2ZJS5_HIBSY|nr:E3 ubiquitin-protein ligase RHA2A-like [Hibiscus syriacus]KAE8691983.1 putative E3 ubiquitin-protein ligase RHA2B [Hibiscus syriacus]
MGLQSQLNDVSSDSIPLLLVAVIAKCVGYLRSLLFGFLHALGLFLCPEQPTTAMEDVGIIGSGLSTLMVLAEKVNLNKAFSYEYCGGGKGSDCILCLCGMRHGEQVRKLDCCHVFHKDCFDGWLDHLNFNCPLCRSPLKTVDRSVNCTRKRVGQDLFAWFCLA